MKMHKVGMTNKTIEKQKTNTAIKQELPLFVNVCVQQEVCTARLNQDSGFS